VHVRWSYATPVRHGNPDPTTGGPPHRSAFGGERAMPKAKPAIQWGLMLFAVFWIVHDPHTTTSMVGDVFTFISNFFHSIGNIVTFHTNT
jgi:hypothetical protein